MNNPLMSRIFKVTIKVKCMFELPDFLSNLKNLQNIGNIYKYMEDFQMLEKLKYIYFITP